LAKRLNVPIRCVIFTASSDLCEHNNAVRALNVSPEVRSISTTEEFRHPPQGLGR
jgi:hypothetical protein